MTHQSRHAHDPSGTVLATVAARATDVDRGHASIADDLQMLRDQGLLDAVTAAGLPGGDWRAGFDLLWRIGGASLSVGRLTEGHVNAARLIALYGTPDQRHRFLDMDRFLGVWGADGAHPVRIAHAGADHVTLQGAKAFCSGLGVVSDAVVSVGAPGGVQLVLVDATDPARANAEGWKVSGMRATASGDYDMNGLQAGCLGRPGDQIIEPHFQGGVWRYLALHAGALNTLATMAAAHLRQGGATDLQKGRLAHLAIAAGTARMWAHAAARSAEDRPADPDAAAAHVLLAREAVEAACLEGLSLADRLFGTRGFRDGSRIDLIRRDLSFFLRQADLDGKLLRAADGLLAAAP